MNTHRTSTPAPTTAEPLPRTLTALRMEAVANATVAGCIVIGAVGVAVYFELPAVALFGIAGAWFALRARWLWGDVQRMAEHLPPKPKRTQARWIMRLYWWIARRQMQRAAQPKPWRGVTVDGVPDAIKLPYQASEAAQAADPAIVHGYTAKDIYAIACEASTRGLGDRAWQFDTRTVKLPSGQNLSREGFRDVKRWLYDRKLAVKSPAWDLAVTPEAVAAELEKE